MTSSSDIETLHAHSEVDMLQVRCLIALQVDMTSKCSNCCHEVSCSLLGQNTCTKMAETVAQLK